MNETPSSILIALFSYDNKKTFFQFSSVIFVGENRRMIKMNMRNKSFYISISSQQPGVANRVRQEWCHAAFNRSKFQGKNSKVKISTTVLALGGLTSNEWGISVLSRSIYFWPCQIWRSHCLNLMVENEHLFAIAAISRSTGLFGTRQVNRPQNNEKNWNKSIHSLFWISSVKLVHFIRTDIFDYAWLKFAMKLNHVFNFYRWSTQVAVHVNQNRFM